MLDQILYSLKRAGLVQFGNFMTDDGYTNATTKFELLPSYPVLLSDIAHVLAEKLASSDYDYILSVYKAIPLATVISQSTGIPLVYENPSVKTPVHRIVGAYDVGHPTALICNTTDNLHSIIDDAQKVGLVVTKVVGVVTTNKKSLSLPVETLFSLSEIIQNAEI